MIMRVQEHEPGIGTVSAPRAGTGARVSVAVGIGLCLASLLGFVALQYVAPGPLPSRWGDNFAGTKHFQRVLLGGAPSPIGSGTAVAWFRALLGAAWAGYGLALWGGWRGAIPPARWMLPAVAAVGVLLAVGCPASLSYDVYAYVAYARMAVLYDLNPYFTPLAELRPLGDPTASIVGDSEMPSVYGPLWTLLCIAVVASTRGASLWLQVVVLKLIQAAALLLAVVAGRDIARRYAPGRGDLVILAVGLNPLLLIEGPGNGHCDLLMMSLMLCAAALGLRGLWAQQGLLLGLSIGVKFLPLAIVPWLVLEQFRERRWRQATWRAVAIAFLALAPSVIGYLPLWQGAETLAPLQTRSRWGAGSGLAKFEQLGAQLASAGAPRLVAWAAVFALRQFPVVVVFLALSTWLWFDRTPGRWLDAWVVLSLGFVTWTMTARYPWYMTWPLAIALTRFTRWGATSLALALLYSIYMTGWYTYQVQ